MNSSFKGHIHVKHKKKGVRKHGRLTGENSHLDPTNTHVCLYICVTYKTQLSLTTIQCPEVQITQDFPPLYLRQIYKLQSLGSFPLLIQY